MLFLIIIFLALLSYLLYRYLTKAAVTWVTLSDFQNQIEAAIKDPSKRFSNVNYKESTGSLIWVLSGGETFETTVNSTLFFSVLNQKIPENVVTSSGNSVSYLEAISHNGLAIIQGGKSLSSVKYVAPSALWSFFVTLAPSLIFLALLFYFSRRAFAGSNNSIIGSPFGGSPARKIKSDKKFSDIAGNEEVKEEVKELVDYLRNSARYKAAGARFPKGILLGGPPGTGKTLIAKAVAGEAEIPFYFISASNFVEMFVGLGAKRVRELFKEARKNSPSIIFIDELDAVGRSRGSGIGNGNDEREQTLNQLLVEMDGIVENSGLLVIAATNRTDVLDPALLRPGRFDRQILVRLPDVKEREAILKIHAAGKRIAKGVEFANIAKRTPGFSGAQLENILNEASILSVREQTGSITLNQIDEAIDRVIAGPSKKTRVISEKENRMVAIHEAGHAVVGIKIPGANKVQKITIIPRGNAGGYNLITPEEEKYNHSKKELIATITSYMGGRAAEEIFYGENNISTGASDDIAKATRIARKMVTEWGMSSLGPIKYEDESQGPFLGRDLAEAKFSQQISQEIDKEVRQIISKAYIEAVNIIKQNMELLQLIAESLIIKETIIAEEIEYIAKNLKLPEEVLAMKESEKAEEEKNSKNSEQKPNLESLLAEVIEK